nr:MAG TPA: hypothetical protein [Caudoviricetes sp.]
MRRNSCFLLFSETTTPIGSGSSLFFHFLGMVTLIYLRYL